MAASAVLHVAFAALILFGLPLPSFEPQQEESVSVELVEPLKPEADAEEQAQKQPAKTPDGEAKQSRLMPSAAQPVEKQPQAEATASGVPQSDQPQAFESSGQVAEKSEAGDSADTDPAADQTKADAEAAAAAIAAEEQARQRAEETRKAAEDLANSTSGEAVPEKTEASTKSSDAAAKEAPVEDTGAAPEAKDKASETVVAKPLQTPDEPERRMAKAKKLLSDKMLSDPRVREALGQLPPNRRIVQICSIEALEQVRSNRPGAFPDLLVPFSTGGGLISGQVLAAKGGAYRSKGDWFNFDFRCEVDAEFTGIVSFQYDFGAAVPSEQWARRKLPAQ